MKQKVIKRNGSSEVFDFDKVKNAINKAFQSVQQAPDKVFLSDLEFLKDKWKQSDGLSVEDIQNDIETFLMQTGYYNVAKAYIIYREKHKNIRDWANQKIKFIEKYKQSDNTANATIDDNSNVASKNIGILNAEIHKQDNTSISRTMIVNKLKELYPEFNAKSYIDDLNSHIIYKHDESSFAGAISPYCSSITMYPFLINGIKGLGGLSAKPKNLDSFCGMYINLIFATSSMFAGAVASSEFLLYFDYFSRKQWGDNYYTKPDVITTSEHVLRKMTIRNEIHQYFQQVIYSINQPASARGMQSAFVNFSYFDKPFFEAMFGEFYFPDGTKPIWESLNWLQKEFMVWFNNERLKTVITFPVESFALIYKDGKFEDEESAKFVAEEYARGHSFFTYISDTADSLSSCCRLKNKVQTKEFNFTNGNLGVQTGSKSVITINLNRVLQDFWHNKKSSDTIFVTLETEFKNYLNSILERVLKYHVAYNELLWDMYNANLLPVYKSGFINLDKQYLTYGINGLNSAAEFLGFKCTNNEDYKMFCKIIFKIISSFCDSHNGVYFNHKVTLNVEQVPAESLGLKNFNWDKEDGYYVGDGNLYTSYIFKPNDPNVSVLDKLIMHSKQFASNELSGGQAAHINLDHHLDIEQYWKLLNFAGKVGCSYFTFNIPNSECDDCGYITKNPIKKCPKCGSEKISYYDRVIGYLTKIKNWSAGRQIEQKTRVYSSEVK